MNHPTRRRATLRLSPLPLMVLLMLPIGCAKNEFRAFDGPPDPMTDIRLTIADGRIRVVSAAGVAAPPDFAEAGGERTIWVRGARAAAVPLTLGIAPHDALIEHQMYRPLPPPPPPGGGVSVSVSGASGYQSSIRYPGSSRNQRFTFVAQPAGQYRIDLNGKLDASKKPVWGFTVTDTQAKTAVPVRAFTWEANATGGVDATPWNLWDLPDDAIEIRSTIYR